MERLSLLLITLLGCSFAMTASAATCKATSPEHKVALLELYTSEGCSSCPPADKWLSELTAKGLDSNQVVPLSLHVDYWNYIGWADPYSSSQYTDRQKEIAWRNRLRTIYTPQLVLQGQDFRSWRRVDLVSLLKVVNDQKAVADINLELNSTSPGVTRLAVNGSVRNPGLYQGGRLVVAVYENRLVSSVTSGENDGRVLKHDYVVRKLYQPVDLADSGSASFSKNLLLEPGWDMANMGVAAFIEHPQHGTLQSLSIKLPCS